MIRPRNLQQPDAPLNPVHNKVSSEFGLFLLHFNQFSSPHPVKVTSLGHDHDGHHSKVPSESNDAPRGRGGAVAIPPDELQAKFRSEGCRVHDAQFTTFSRTKLGRYGISGAARLIFGGHSYLYILQPKLDRVCGFSHDVSDASIFRLTEVNQIQFEGHDVLHSAGQADV